MGKKLAVALFLFALGVSSAPAQQAPARGVEKFNDWEVGSSRGMHAALLSQTHTGNQDQGDNGFLALICDPEPGQCRWVLSARAQCEEGKAAILNATFALGGGHFLGETFVAGCSATKNGYYQYDFRQADAGRLYGRLGASELLTFELSLPSGGTKAIQFRPAGMWGANSALMRRARPQAEEKAGPP